MRAGQVKARVFILLATVALKSAVAQEVGYKGNPHIFIPSNDPPQSIPFDQQHVVIRIPDPEITNLFSKGYQTFGGEVSMIRIASRRAPERQYFAKIGDFIGSYRIDRLVGTGMNYAVYLVKSNETVAIRARGPAETHNNRILPPGSGTAAPHAPPPER